MTLELENICRVRYAKLDFKGLTVIVGDNNSGKSTVGKVLASLFTVFSSIDESVMRARCEYVFDENVVRYGYRFRYMDLDAFTSLFCEEDLTEEIFLDRVVELWKSWYPRKKILGRDGSADAEEIDLLKEMSHVAFARLMECRKIPSSQLVDIEVGKVFSWHFYGAVKSGTCERARVNLVVQGVANEVVWDKSVHCSVRTTFVNRGWFLGSPVLINAISDSSGVFHDLERMHEPLLRCLRNCSSSNSVSRAIVGKKIRPIEERLEAVLEGQISYSDETEELMISGKGYPRPLPVQSLSMGLKAFALLRWMLEKGVLRERDVLVLDEPENHLHPRWQILYAELIVMLQKSFDLTVLLTTHSPYFLEAIQLYAKKYGIADRLSAYQPVFDEPRLTTTIDCPITDSSNLYKKFTAPLRDLDILRAEV